MRASAEPPRSESEAAESRRIPRRFRRRYLLALGTVAVLAIGGQIGVQVALAAQRDSGRLVNEAGLQRMLSQRLALKLLLPDEAGPAERAERRAEIARLSARWQDAHAQLREQAGELASDAAAREALAALFAAVDQPLQALAQLADAVAAGAVLTPAQRDGLLREQEVFLPLMDATVREIERSAATRVAALQRAELGLLLLTLGVLAAQALLIFRPAEFRLAHTLAELEQKRRDSAGRLESLRHLSGGIAHHFNNILTSILGNAELIRLEADGNRRVSDYAGAQVEQCRRAADMIAQLVLYAGDRDLNPRPTALGPWLQDTVQGIPPPPGGVPVRVEVREDAVATVDTGMLRDAVEGLIANAVEATPPGGPAVTVELSQVVLAEPLAMSGPYHLRLPAGLYARVRVIDGGVGIPRSELERIFDPFYSRKSFGRGLGLASILGVAHAHQGGLALQSQPGDGTRISLYLPLSVDPPAVVARPGGSHSPWRLPATG